MLALLRDIGIHARHQRSHSHNVEQQPLVERVETLGIVRIHRGAKDNGRLLERQLDLEQWRHVALRIGLVEQITYAGLGT